MAIVEEQQFCLRWNNFQANITSQFETLRDDEDFVDVTLACDGQRFEAHKVVLSACSPFFKELFKSNPCTHPIIFMRDVDARHIVALLEFMYAGEVNVAQAHLSGFLRTAESLQIRGLTDASKVQKDNKLHKDNDNHKHNNTSENANEHTKPSNNSTSQTNFSSYDRSRKCESPPPQPRSHTPSTQNDDIVVHHDKIKISRPIAQCSPPPPKRVCKTESLLIGDDMENSKTQFDMTLSPSSTNNSNLNNHYINQAEIHTELDLTADMIEPKTEPDYQSDGEQDHVERSLDETMLGFEGSETGNSFGVVQGYYSKERENEIFVALLRDLPVLFNKSQAPFVKTEKEDAILTLVTKFNFLTGNTYTVKQGKKKIHNMKTEVKRKLYRCSYGLFEDNIVIKKWQKDLADLMA